MREILNAFTAGDHQVAKLKDLRALGLPLPGEKGSGTDLGATPPKPTGLNMSGALATIILAWDATNFDKLSHTEIWRAQSNDFSLAQMVGRSDGRIYVDNVGGAAVRFYWIRYVSQANVVGPFNAQLGTRGETGADPAYLLSLLTGQVTQSQLYADLGNKIELITAPASTAGSVAQRILAETTARDKAIAAEANLRIAAFLAEAKDRGTAIGQESTLRQEADNALAQEIQYLVAASDTNLAAYKQVVTVIATGDSALSSRIESLAAQTADNITAAIQKEETARTKADSAEVAARQVLSSKVLGVADPATVGAVASLSSGLLFEERNLRTTADTSLGTRIDSLTATVNDNVASITREEKVRADADTALTELAQYLSAATATSLAASQVAYSAQVTADTAVSQRIESLVAETAAGLKAAIVSEQTVRATADSATATELKQLQAIVSDPSTGLVAKYAAVKVLADASVTALGKVQAKYTVNIDVDGIAGGFGIIGSGDGLTSTIDFGVRASTFFVAGPSGNGIAPSTPFIVRTTASVINGVNVPAGVYIADGFIANGTITNAKIGNAAIDDAKIASLNAGKITAGDIAATRMQANIVTALIGKFSTLSALAASLGQIEINAGGYLRTQGVSSFTVGAGLWMGQVDGVYKFRVGNPMGNYMQWDGSSLTITGSGQFSGKLMGASGEFSGNLVASSGTLGVITAGLLRNTANTSYMNLNASGAEPFLSVGNGAIVLRANGSGQFSRELISEPNVISRGVTGVNVGWVGYMGGEHIPFTVYIDTNVGYPDGWYDAPSIAYMATATIATGKSNNGGINGFTQAEIVSGDGLGNLNAYPIDNRIYIKFTWTPTTGTGQILPETIKWKLVRV